MLFFIVAVPIYITCNSVGTSQVVLLVKNMPANEGDVRDMGLIPGWKGPLEKRMATHSSVLAWRILWTEEPGRLQSIWLQIVGHD